MKMIIISLIILLVVLSAFFLKSKIGHQKFNSEVWKTANLNEDENWSLRWDMMKDLRNKHGLVGKTKNEIKLY